MTDPVEEHSEQQANVPLDAAAEGTKENPPSAVLHLRNVPVDCTVSASIMMNILIIY